MTHQAENSASLIGPSRLHSSFKITTTITFLFLNLMTAFKYTEPAMLQLMELSTFRLIRSSYVDRFRGIYFIK